MKCPRCSSELREGELVCPKCSYSLPNSTNTINLRVDPTLLRVRREYKASHPLATENAVTLSIRGMSERLDISKIKNLTLGRADLDVGFQPDVDLTPYGAAERGVSRSHVLLNYVESELTVTDLDSSNGTLLNGTRLKPGNVYRLHDGDELILGRLPIAVSFPQTT